MFTNKELIDLGFKHLSEKILINGRVKYVTEKPKKGTTYLGSWFQVLGEPIRGINSIQQVQELLNKHN